MSDAAAARPNPAVATTPTQVGRAVAVPLAERGEAVVRAMLGTWANPDLARVMRTSLLIAGHEAAAMARVRAVFTDGLIPAIAPGLDPDEVSVRGGLVSSHMVGLAFALFVFAFDDAAAIPDGIVVAMVGPTVQRYLTEPQRRSGRPASRPLQARSGSGCRTRWRRSAPRHPPP